MSTGLGGGEARASSLGEGVGGEGNDIGIIVHEEVATCLAPPRAEGCLGFIGVKLEEESSVWILCPGSAPKGNLPSGAPGSPPQSPHTGRGGGGALSAPSRGKLTYGLHARPLQHYYLQPTGVNQKTETGGKAGKKYDMGLGKMGARTDRRK